MKIIDWDLGVRLVGNKRETAEEMLKLLTKNLSHDLNQFDLYLKQNNYDELARLIHKFYGALCYCGTPRLKQAAAELESSLKQNNHQNLYKLYEHLSTEAKLVLEHYDAYCSNSSF